MQRVKTITLSIFLIFVFSLSTLASNTNYSTKPNHSCPPSKKWRIAYLQGGDYIDYRKTLSATIEGLMVLGWIKPFDIQKMPKTDANAVWQWLAHETRSNHLRFVHDAFYCAEWEPNSREKVVNKINKRIQKNGDIDLIIAMGTWAGQDLSKLSLDTNVLVMSASDPVASGIIESPYDSGAKNLHAHIFPALYEQQIRLFHDQVDFKKLGIIFEDSITGRSYSGIDAAKRLSNELDFEIVTCFAVSDIPDSYQTEKAYLRCVDKIASEIDALYVTVHGGVTERSLPLIVERSKHHRLPTFSQSGSHEVETGLLMSLSRIDFKKVGLFQAAIMANVFNGAKPGELNQVFEEPLDISLNLNTAERIGHIPSAAVIAAADKLYNDDAGRK